MKKVYLVMVFDSKTGRYLSTLQIAFTSRKAAEKYCKDLTVPCAISQVDLVSLKNF